MNGDGELMVQRQLLKIVQMIFPALIMIGLTYYAFSASDDLFTKQFILNALIIYFPVLFLLQGAFCAFLRENIIVSIAISVVGFITVIFVWLNSSALIYLVLYVILWLIGYGIVRFFRKT